MGVHRVAELHKPSHGYMGVRRGTQGLHRSTTGYIWVHRVTWGCTGLQWYNGVHGVGKATQG